jgi:peptide/nickel transport system permease protein
LGTRSYLLRKVAGALATLTFVLAFNFVLFRAIGDPVKLLTRSQTHLDEQEAARLREEFGLDKNLFSQFLGYIPDTLTGHLGTSFISGRPVTAVIGERIPKTVLLVGVSTVLSTVLGMLAGIRGAWRRGSAFDQGSLLGSLVFYSMPEGWLGMLLLVAFSGALGWFPSGGYQSGGGDFTGLGHISDVAKHVFLPCLTLTLGYIGEYAIIMRSSLLEVLGEEYIQTARAKGLRDDAVRRRHAVPNALLPTLALVFYSFGFVLGGSIIVEAVYSYPGLGLLEFQAIGSSDFPVIQAVFLLSSAAVILFNLAADILYGYLDPRIRVA